MSARSIAVNLLHRSLFRDVLFATLAAVLLFALMLLSGVAVHDLVSRTASGQLTVAQAGLMLGLILPSLLTYSLPFGLLTGILLVLGRLSAQNEITAMRSAGFGLIRISAPVLLIALLGVAVSLVINFKYAPLLKTEYRRLLFEVGQTNPAALIVPGTFVRDFPGAVIYTREREGDTLKDVWFWLVDQQHRVTLFAWAEQGFIEVDEADNTLSIYSLGKLRVDFRNEKDPEDFSAMTMPASADSTEPHLVHRIELADVFKRKIFNRKPSWLDLGELLAERRRLAPSAVPADRERLQDVKMSLNENAARAFGVLSMALVAIPLGIQSRRKETSANLGIAMGLLLVFEAGFVAIGWLGKSPELHPEMLLWLPNFVFQLLGAWLWHRFGRN